MTVPASETYCIKQTPTGKNLHLSVELSMATEAQFTMACKMSQSSSTIENEAEICVPE